MDELHLGQCKSPLHGAQSRHQPEEIATDTPAYYQASVEETIAALQSIDVARALARSPAGGFALTLQEDVRPSGSRQEPARRFETTRRRWTLAESRPAPCRSGDAPGRRGNGASVARIHGSRHPCGLNRRSADDDARATTGIAGIDSATLGQCGNGDAPVDVACNELDFRRIRRARLERRRRRCGLLSILRAGVAHVPGGRAGERDPGPLRRVAELRALETGRFSAQASLDRRGPHARHLFRLPSARPVRHRLTAKF
jgi:hypothetical protein